MRQGVVAMADSECELFFQYEYSVHLTVCFSKVLQFCKGYPARKAYFILGQHPPDDVVFCFSVPGYVSQSIAPPILSTLQCHVILASFSAWNAPCTEDALDLAVETHFDRGVLA